jgi:hypothetical protein
MSQDALTIFEEDYREYNELEAPYLLEAYNDTKVYLGDQWPLGELNYLKDEGRNGYSYNKIHRNVKMVTGYERKNRLSFWARPQEDGDNYTAEILSDVMLWATQRDDMHHTISRGFEGALVPGFALASVWMDASEDPVSRDIRLSLDYFNSVALDPYWTKMDLSDCRYILRRRYVTKTEAMSLVPGARSRISKMHALPPDGKFEYMPYSQRGDNKMFTYDEHWRQKMKSVKLLIDNATGETRVWKGNERALMEYLRQFPQIQAMDTFIKSIELTIFVNREQVYQGPGPEGLNEYPFIPFIGFHHPEFDKFELRKRGIVRTMIDPQMELNKRRSKMVDILDSQANSGFIFKEGSVKNPLDLFRTGQGVLIELDRNANPGDVERIAPADLPQGQMQLAEIVDNDIMSIPGINEELLGLGDAGTSEISGTLAKVRSANGLTILQDLFDNLSMTKKLIGKKMIKLIQKNFIPEKIARITNKEVPDEIYNGSWGKYDSVVGEGMLTDTQKSLYYAQLIQAHNSGIHVPQSEVIRSLPAASKSTLMAAYEEEDKARKKQEEVIQEQQRINNELANAKIIGDLSLAAERRSRMVADEALARERISEAQVNRAEAIVKQLEGVQKMAEIDQKMLIDGLAFIFDMNEKSRALEKTDIEESSQRALQQVAATSGGAGQQLPVASESEIPG